MTTPCWFPLCFRNCHWAFASFPAHVWICTELFVMCVSQCVQVCSPSLPYHSWPLQKGLSLALPLPTVKFPLWTARTMQTLPCLPTTSASALEAIYRPQPQEYLCLRHPIISLWRCGEKGPMVSGPGNCVTVGLTQISSSSDKNSGKVRRGDNKSGRDWMLWLTEALSGEFRGKVPSGTHLKLCFCCNFFQYSSDVAEV